MVKDTQSSKDLLVLKKGSQNSLAPEIRQVIEAIFIITTRPEALKKYQNLDTCIFVWGIYFYFWYACIPRMGSTNIHWASTFCTQILYVFTQCSSYPPILHFGISVPNQMKSKKAKFSQLCFLTVQTRLASGYRPLIPISKLLALSACLRWTAYWRQESCSQDGSLLQVPPPSDSPRTPEPIRSLNQLLSHL